MNSPHPTDKHVGNRVRMRRHMLGLTQTALADALGIAFQQVQKYEKGTNRISASRLHQIAKVLQMPTVYFFEASPHQTGAPKGNCASLLPDYVSKFLSTKDGLSLTRVFMHVKDRNLRRNIVHLVEAIAGEEG